MAAVYLKKALTRIKERAGKVSVTGKKQGTFCNLPLATGPIHD